MDFSKLKPSDSPQKMELIDPTTGTVLQDEQGNVPYIMLYGEDSAVYQKRQRTITNRQIAQSERLRRFSVGSSEQTEKDLMDTTVACTASWGHIAWNGQELECTPENAHMLYSEVRWIYEQARTFILDRANFTKLPSTGSASEQSGTSPSRSRLKAVAGSSNTPSDNT